MKASRGLGFFTGVRPSQPQWAFIIMIFEAFVESILCKEGCSIV